MFRPKLFICLKDYSVNRFMRDVQSGIIVAIVAVPLAIAFAIASGLSPDKGLITAIIAGFLISALGGSRVQIGGPTGAFVVIVAGIVSTYGVEGLIAATFIGGIILSIFGLLGLGGVIKFIPYPVTVGFTSGIAVVIASTQLKDFMGLSVGSIPSDFLEKMQVLLSAIPTYNIYAVLLSVSTIIITLGIQRLSKKLPSGLIVLSFLTFVTNTLSLPVETIGSVFGNISGCLSLPHFPTMNFMLIKEIFPAALSIAVLAGIESLLSAVVADGMIGGKHRSNTELIAQGIANIGSSLFGGMPATGAIARTAVNVHNGGRTPVAGIVHAVVLLLIMLIFSSLIKYIPLAVLSGLLMLVAYRMSEWKSFTMILKAPGSDQIVLIITFLLTVFVDLTAAIQFGVVLASFLLIHRLSNTPNVSVVSNEITKAEGNSDVLDIASESLPKGVEVYEIVGPFFFGVATKFIDTVNSIENRPLVRILRMRNVLTIDATALNALRTVVAEEKKHGVTLMISGVHSQPLTALERSGLLNEIGMENVFSNIDDALAKAKNIITDKNSP